MTNSNYLIPGIRIHIKMFLCHFEIMILIIVIYLGFEISDLVLNHEIYIVI